jgi:hypothetical protein
METKDVAGGGGASIADSTSGRQGVDAWEGKEEERGRGLNCSQSIMGLLVIRAGLYTLSESNLAYTKIASSHLSSGRSVAPGFQPQVAVSKTFVQNLDERFQIICMHAV